MLAGMQTDEDLEADAIAKRIAGRIRKPRLA